MGDPVNKISKTLRWALSVVACLLLLVIFLLSIGIRINLSPWHDTILATANSQLPYHLALDGELEATIAFRPSIRVSDIKLSSLETPDQPLITVSSVSAKVGILPFLSNTINIDHVVLESVSVDLQRDENGQANWATTSEKQRQVESEPKEPADFKFPKLPGFDLKIDNRLAIEGLSLVYTDAAQSQHMTGDLDVLNITLDADNHLQLSADGSFQNEPWTLKSRLEWKSLLTDQSGALAVNGAFANIPLTGNIVFSEDSDALAINTTLLSQNVDLTPLLSKYIQPDARGTLENLQLQANIQGKNIPQFIQNATTTLTLDHGSLHLGEDDWKIHSIHADAGFPQSTQIDVHAELLNIPVHANITAEPLAALQDNKPWQMEATLDSPAFNGQVTGFVSDKGLRQDSQFNLNLSAQKLGALSSWLGVRDDIAQPMNLRGQATLENNRVSLNLSEFVIGQTTAEILAEWHPGSDNGLANIVVHLPALDLDELHSFLPEAKEQTTSEAVASTPRQGPTPGPTPGPRPGPTPGSAPGAMAGPTPGTVGGAMASAPTSSDNQRRNAPLLRRDIAIPDANIDFRIDELLVAGKNISNMSFRGGVKDGWLKPSPFSADFAGSRFYGDMSLSLRHQTVDMVFDLGVDKPDFGRILTELDMVNSMPLSLDSAHVSLQLKGRTLDELIQHIRLNANLQGGSLELVDANTGVSQKVLLESGSLTAQPNMRLTLKMDGELKELPVELEVSFNPLSRLITNPKNVTMQLSVRMPDIHLLSYSVVSLPLDKRFVRLGVILKTPSLAALNPLLGVDLPPWGPIDFHGRFGINPEGYEIRQSKIQVGDSSLIGDMRLLTTGEKPELSILLNTPTIQIDDFKLGDWQAWSRPEEDKQQSTETASTNKEETDSHLISADTLNALNAELKIEVDEVLSGKDKLGEGQLHLMLEDGSLSLNPLRVALPGGEIYVNGHLTPQEEGFRIGLNADVDHFDYGVLARRISPETDMKGTVSFHMDINTLAQTPDDLFHHALGDFGFAVWPQDFEAGIIDLWAVGLLSAVLPRIGPSDPSQLNCMVGTFQLEDGQMKNNVLMLDTSQMQVAGNTQVNFTDEKINLVLVPRAKEAQIFGLSLPIMITGGFNDFGFGIPSGELIVTTLRFITSPVIAPVSWLFAQPLQEDGSAMCQQFYDQSRSPVPVRPASS